VKETEADIKNRRHDGICQNRLSDFRVSDRRSMTI